jgi:hypothetical protein
MSGTVIAWDIETIPDLKGFAAANGHDGKSDDEIRTAMEDIYHSIIYIGALIARQENDSWVINVVGAPTSPRSDASTNFS